MKESLVICDLAWPIYPVKYKTDDSGFAIMECKILAAITGKNIDEDSFNLIGERIFNLQRAIMIRQGSRGWKDDTIMDYYHEEPLSSMFKNPDCIAPGKGREQISRKGEIFDRNEFERLKEEYYSLRGWDRETGLQTFAKLRELDLEDIALDLNRLGLIKNE